MRWGLFYFRGYIGVHCYIGTERGIWQWQLNRATGHWSPSTYSHGCLLP